ncbi:MAG: histidine phosphatase family protein [Beijerinckiaceae bacterium]
MTQVIGLIGYDRLAALATETPFAPRRSRFIFIRHGETEGNRTRVFQQPHIPLNEAGEAQARKAAAGLRAITIGKLVASPMARAWRTAMLVGAEHHVVPEADGALSERFYVNLWDTPVTSGGLDWAHDPEGCETLEAFVSRARHGLLRILADDRSQGETVIVAHGGILLVVCAATGVQLTEDLRRNAVPLLFERVDGAWRGHSIRAD